MPLHSAPCIQFRFSKEMSCCLSSKRPTSAASITAPTTRFDAGRIWSSDWWKLCNLCDDEKRFNFYLWLCYSDFDSDRQRLNFGASFEQYTQPSARTQAPKVYLAYMADVSLTDIWAAVGAYLFRNPFLASILHWRGAALPGRWLCLPRLCWGFT